MSDVILDKMANLETMCFDIISVKMFSAMLLLTTKQTILNWASDLKFCIRSSADFLGDLPEGLRRRCISWGFLVK